MPLKLQPTKILTDAHLSQSDFISDTMNFASCDIGYFIITYNVLSFLRFPMLGVNGPARFLLYERSL